MIVSTTNNESSGNGNCARAIATSEAPNRPEMRQRYCEPTNGRFHASPDTPLMLLVHEQDPGDESSARCVTMRQELISCHPF
jgi:hypothetical protein